MVEKLRAFPAGIICALVLLLPGVAHAATVTLAWDANAEPVTGYIVYWGTQPGQYTQSRDVGKTTTATITPTTVNATYYFVVKAYNSAGMSVASGQVGAWYGA